MKYSKKEYKESLLKHCKFKKKWCNDKSGYWFEKKIKIGDFKGKLIYDETYCYMEIEVFKSPVMDSKEKSYEIIWKGKWSNFEKLIKKYK